MIVKHTKAAAKHQPPPVASLAERIRQIQTEADELLRKRAADLHAEYPNIPEPVLLMQMGRGCPCRSALRVLEGD